MLTYLLTYLLACLLNLPSSSVFELGCGVGAALKVVLSLWQLTLTLTLTLTLALTLTLTLTPTLTALKVLSQWQPVEIGGCDTSAAALKVAAAHFAPRAHAFTLSDMASGELPPGAAERSFDHVVSFGALARYIRLQAPSHTVAASILHGCSLRHVRLQARSPCISSARRWPWRCTRYATEGSNLRLAQRDRAQDCRAQD